MTGTVQCTKLVAILKHGCMSFFGYVISISLVPRLPPVQCMGELGTGLHLGMRVPEQGQCKMAVSRNHIPMMFEEQLFLLYAVQVHLRWN